jgi:DNA-binding beta-propeller fold protein YncE
VDRIEICTMPHGVRMHPSGSHVYTVCMMDDQLVEVDTRRFDVSRRFSLRSGAEGPLGPGAPAAAEYTGHGAHAGHVPPTCSPTWAVPGAVGDRLYVACNRSDEILEIGTERWELLRRFATGRGPYNLDVTADGRLLIATLKQGNGVQFFDLESGATLAETPTSTTVVHGVVVSPDDRFAFVSVEGVGAEPGKVDVFDLRTFERVASVEVGQQAAGITLLRMEAR